MPDDPKFEIVRTRTVRKGKRVTLTITMMLKDAYTAIELYDLMTACVPVGGIPGVTVKETEEADTMVTRATGSQSTKTVPRQGQNKPQSGGAAGAGKDRGTAKLPTISRTTAPKSR
jgi:hypothetical protein